MDDYADMAAHAIDEMVSQGIHFANLTQRHQRKADSYRDMRDTYINSLHEVGYSHRKIAALLSISPSLVVKVISKRKVRP